VLTTTESEPRKVHFGKRFLGRYNSNVTGLMFVLPGLLLILGLIFYPIVKALYYSFFNWDGVTASFIGFQNYVSLFHSGVFHTIIRNNLVLLLSIPLWVLIPLVIAFLLHMEPPGWKVFRFIFFIPTALSWVIIGIVWQFFFAYHGSLNSILQAVGLGFLQRDWFTNPGLALTILICTAIWAWFGTGVIIFSVGLSTIPSEILEAAQIEGCRGLRLLWHIVLPSIRSFIELYAIYSLIMAFTQMFGLIYVMTQGGPGYYTTTGEYYIYTTAFQNEQFGLASAVGVLLLLIILIASLVQIRLNREVD